MKKKDLKKNDFKQIGGPTLKLFFALKVAKQYVLCGIQMFFNITVYINLKINPIQYIIS